jgi:hypothetical protein
MWAWVRIHQRHPYRDHSLDPVTGSALSAVGFQVWVDLGIDDEHAGRVFPYPGRTGSRSSRVMTVTPRAP